MDSWRLEFPKTGSCQPFHNFFNRVFHNTTLTMLDLLPTWYFQIITSRIRRIGEGNTFSLSTLAGRGVPRPRSRWGGVPHLKSGYRGNPISGLGKGVPHPRSRWGVPHLKSGYRGYLVPGLGGGVPHLRSG